MTDNLTKLAETTYENNHTNAYIEGCKYLRKIVNAIGGSARDIRRERLNVCIKELRKVAKACEGDKYIETKWIVKRGTYYDEMMMIAKRMLNKADFNAFYTCF